MKKLFNVSDIQGFSEKVAQSVATGELSTFNFEEVKRDPNTLFRAGFYFLVDSETGMGLNVYYVGRQRVNPKSRFAYGFYATTRSFSKGQFGSPGYKLIKHSKKAKIDVYYVSVQNAKYLTNKLGKQGSLFAKFAKTETDVYNNMQEIKNQIKDNFKFKYKN
ncbi:hypothetical protein [Providencia phage PSTCR6]|nr:hypothetical protein [Providencia phage PSTCR6]